MEVRRTTYCRPVCWNFRVGAMLLALLIPLIALLAPEGTHGAPRTSATLFAQAAQAPTSLFSVIVQKERLPGNPALEPTVTQLGGIITRDLPLINGFGAELSGTALMKLASLPGVRWISENSKVISSGTIDHYSAWYCNGPDGSYGTDLVNKLSGYRSLRLSGTSSSEVRCEQTVSVVAGQQYRLAGYIKTDPGVTGVLGVRSGLTSTIYGEVEITGNNFSSKSVNVTPANGVYVLTIYAVLKNQNGKAYFDDLSFISHSATNKNLLTNNGFEALASSGWLCNNSHVTEYGGNSAGRYALRLTSSSSKSALCEQVISVTKGQEYKLQAMAAASGTYAIIGIGGDSNESWTTSNYYQQLSKRFVASSDTVVVRLRAPSGYSGYAYFDDVSLMPVSPSNPNPKIGVNFVKVKEWDTGYEAQVTIVNGGTSIVNGWTVSFDLWQTVRSVWSATMTSSGSRRTVRNVSWNGVIYPGDSVSFGFTADYNSSYIGATNCAFNGVAQPCNTGPTNDNFVANGDFEIGSTLLNPYQAIIGNDRLWRERPDLKGQGVTVAVVDSGLTWNEDFNDRDTGQNRIKTNVEFNAKTDVTTDDYGHGTHIAGIIGGNGKRSNGLVVGVAPKVNLLNVKFSNSQGTGDASELINALQWVYDNQATYNIRVVNLSINTTSENDYLRDPINAAVQALWFKGIVVVVAVGNNGQTDPNKVYTPANDPYVITVGAMFDKGTVDRVDDVLASYSAYHICPTSGICKPDLVVPGSNIVAPLASSEATMSKDHPERLVHGFTGASGYYRLSGTSMAAPIVSGGVALLLQAEYQRTGRWMTPDQVKYRLMNTADALGLPGTGRGYLNIYRAITSVTVNGNGNAHITQYSLRFRNGNRTPAYFRDMDWSDLNGTSYSLLDPSGAVIGAPGAIIGAPSFNVNVDWQD